MEIKEVKKVEKKKKPVETMVEAEEDEDEEENIPLSKAVGKTVLFIAPLHIRCGCHEKVHHFTVWH